MKKKLMKALGGVLSAAMLAGSAEPLAVSAYVYNGWEVVNGNYYWYEYGMKQGLQGRGKEIYDPGTMAWYWLDAVEGGRKATNKDVYQESEGGVWSDYENGTGKWVRYDAEGHMVKGFYENEWGNTYYFDLIYGTMAKGYAIIDGQSWYFDKATGIGRQCSWENLNGWVAVDGIKYWYENGARQGVVGRGKEIYDPDANAWFWLDAVSGGQKAVDKDVYQSSSIAGKWADNPDGTGKWVRYDSQGHMIKGWNVTESGHYYFDPVYGTMAKGVVEIDGVTYRFNEGTGILEGAVADDGTLEPTPTPAPTAVPTAEPTAVPTAEPTAVPTGQPVWTPEPTAVPTQRPAGTPEPTAVPTQRPAGTPEPTAVPTPSPTPFAWPTFPPIPPIIIQTPPPQVTPKPLATATPAPTAAPVQEIAGIYFSVGDNGGSGKTLYISGTVQDPDKVDWNKVDWSSIPLKDEAGNVVADRSEITNAVLEFAGVASLKGIFKNYRNLQTVVFPSDFATKNTVKNLESMFEGCSALANIIDLQYLSTDNVENMSKMFYNCENLSSLKFPATFKTDKVKYMEGLFYGCKKLSKLDLSTFNTKIVETMNGMFGNCSSLSSIILSENFTTGNVSTMASMFSGCTNLKEVQAAASTPNIIDLTYFETPLVDDMSNMFSNCTKITNLNLTTFETRPDTSINGMFKGCTSLKEVWGDDKWKAVFAGNVMFDGDNDQMNIIVKEGVVDKEGIYWRVEKDNEGGYKLTVRDGRSSWLTEGYNQGAGLNLESVPWGNGAPNTINFEDDNLKKLITSATLEFTAKAKSLSGYFSEYTALKEVDLSQLNMAAVTNMSSMFSGCSSLETIIWPTTNTPSSGVTISGAFINCSNIKYIDLQGIPVSTASKNTFENCNNLVLVMCSQGQWTTSAANEKVEEVQVSDVDSTYGLHWAVTSANNLYNLYVWGNVKEGKKVPAKWFQAGSPWSSKGVNNTDICSAYIDVVGLTTASGIFKEYEGMTKVTVTDMSEVATMANMFNGCTALEEVNLPSDTSIATSMANMFKGCTALDAVTLKLDASAVTTMLSMFEGCNNLQTVDLSSFNTPVLINTRNMFKGCSNLLTLNMENFNGTGVTKTNSTGMFDGCTNALLQFYFYPSSDWGELPYPEYYRN